MTRTPPHLAAILAALWLALSGCTDRDTGDAEPEAMPPPLSETERARGLSACQAYVQEVCACAAAKPDDPALKVPHMGWNTLAATGGHPLLDGIKLGPEGWHAYFLHGYHLVAEDEEDVIAFADYGGPVTAIVARGNVAGTQFHPEKSQKLGLKLIANFLAWKP